MVLAVPSMRTWSPGDIATSSMLNAQLRDGTTFALQPPLCRCVQTATQNVANNAWVSITFDTNVIDTYTGHSTTSNTSRYVAQVAGWYEVLAVVAWAISSTNSRGSRLAVNGTAVQGGCTFGPGGAINATGVPVSDTVFLNAGDYVETQAWQSSGGTLATFSASDLASRMAIRWVHT